MKPTFALNLSHDGISLLHRAKSGWLRVGDVTLDDPGLNDKLKMLRSTAAGLDSAGMTCKLVIPNSQILYTEIEAPGPDNKARIAQIRERLIGLTPYDVSDLVFDWRMSGTRAHVAVVARETLAEAEAFAAEFKFNPVSFVAVPDNGAFDGEPFFGPTRHARTLLGPGEMVEPDRARLEIIGTERARRAPPPVEETEPKPESSEQAAEPPPVEPTEALPADRPENGPEKLSDSGSDTVADTSPVAESVAGSELDGQGESATAAPVPTFRARRRGSPPQTPPGTAPSEPSPAPDLKAGNEKPAADPLPAFSSRRLPPRPHDKPDTTTALPVFSARRTEPAAAAGIVAAPEAPSRWGGKAPDTATLQGDRGKPSQGTVAPSLSTATPVSDKAPMPTIAPTRAAQRGRGSGKGQDVTHLPMTASETAEAEDPADRRRAARERAQATARAAGTALVGTLGRLGQSTASGLEKLRDRGSAAAETPTKTSTEAEALTVFGARGKAGSRGKPRYLGLTLTVALLTALAILALWSSLVLNDDTASFTTPEPETAATGLVTPETPAAAAPETAVLRSVLPTPRPAREAAGPETEPETEPEIAAASEILATPIESAIEDALASPTPETGLEPADATEAGASVMSGSEAALPLPVETVTDASLAGSPETGAATVEAPALTEPVAPDIEIAALEPGIEPETEAEPEPEPVGDLLTAPPPTRAEAEASYAATGIWQLDPDPLDIPGGGATLEDFYVASIDPVVSAQDAIALPDARRMRNDRRPPSLTPPPALGTTFDFDARGLVRATPEGALNPDGVPVFLGRPAVVPGPRPADLEVPRDDTRALDPASDDPDSETAELPAPDVDRLRLILPRLRPTTLVADAERDRLGGFSREELAAIRPVIRPASLQELATAEAAAAEAAGNSGEEATLLASLGGTELAVFSSAAPLVRPPNFATTVERAREESNTASTNNAEIDEPEPGVETAAAPAGPPLPVRASVAKQATDNNAINLSKVNLIGVYGSPSSRRALIRLSSGRFVKVEVGDKVDGGRVAAIGDNSLQYVKGGRNITLTMPKG